jgi:hypothetical protein
MPTPAKPSGVIEHTQIDLVHDQYELAASLMPPATLFE